MLIKVNTASHKLVDTSCQPSSRFLVIALLYAGFLLGWGRVEDRRNTEVGRTWFSYFRLTEDGETQLRVTEEWEYDLVKTAPASRRSGVLSGREQREVEELFSNGIADYAFDSRSSSDADMGECDATRDHPVVHRVLIDYDPPVGVEGFGCWSPNDDLTGDTQMMIERIEALLQTLSSR